MIFLVFFFEIFVRSQGWMNAVVYLLTESQRWRKSQEVIRHLSDEQEFPSTKYGTLQQANEWGYLQ